MAEPVEPKAVVEAEKKKERRVPLYKLFSCADGLEWLLMKLRSLGAVVHGSAMPVIFLFFGDLVNGFGKNQEDPLKVTHEVSKVTTISRFEADSVCGSRFVAIYLVLVLPCICHFFQCIRQC